MRTVLADFKLALCIKENLGQLWEAMQEESMSQQASVHCRTSVVARVECAPRSQD